MTDQSSQPSAASAAARASAVPWIPLAMGASAVALLAAGAIYFAGGANSAPANAEPRALNFVGAPTEVERSVREAPWNIYTGKQSKIGAGNAPALQFPPGVSYKDALLQLMRASVNGKLPAGVTVVAALPKGKVLAPASGRQGLRLNSAAPFGYDPDSGTVETPLYVRSTPIAEQAATAAFDEMVSRRNVVPAGFGLSVPTLRKCQVVSGAEEARC